MIMTANDRRAFADATDCHICDEALNNDRVHDHFHITGKYRGAAHSACHINLRIYPNKTKVPVVFHNLRGYDRQLIMSALGKSEAIEGQKISCIPNNMEKYMAFSVGQLQFIDSLHFMSSSLGRLASNLQTEDLAVTSLGLTDMELTLLVANVCTHTSMLTVSSGLMMLPSKEAFTFQEKTSATQTTDMHSRHGAFSDARRLVTTMTFT